MIVAVSPIDPPASALVATVLIAGWARLTVVSVVPAPVARCPVLTTVGPMSMAPAKAFISVCGPASGRLASTTGTLTTLIAKSMTHCAAAPPVAAGPRSKKASGVNAYLPWTMSINVIVNVRPAQAPEPVAGPCGISTPGSTEPAGQSPAFSCEPQLGTNVMGVCGLAGSTRYESSSNPDS